MSADDKLYDWIAEQWFATGVSPTDAKRIGKLVRDLKIKRATVDQLKRALRNFRQVWPGMTDTPEAIVKHWDRMIADTQLTATVIPGQPSKAENEQRRVQSMANRWYFGISNDKRIEIWKRVAIHVLEKHDEARVKAIESDLQVRALAMWLFEVKRLR